MRRLSFPLLCCLLCAIVLRADTPAFDLTGPKVDMHVKRGEVTLPIGQVPNLLPGDRLWIHPDLPESQSTHFVLVVAFLRGATNPPPVEWFTRVETWTRAARNEGVFVQVPAEAQQALIFLAPETGGDFSTLRKAVHDRPGAFVRAAQDLQAASLDRMRLEDYLAELRTSLLVDPKPLKERAERSARSLGIHLDQQCFDKPSDQQAPCLVQHTDGIVLDDAGTQSRVETLATGSTGDLMSQLSSTTMAGGGAYSPYIGAIVDTAKIFASLHTAHFQYIPALALPAADTLNLRLNVPPSFRDPKSVVVVALPPVGPAKVPVLHSATPTENYCAAKPGITLEAEGAPLVFATQLVHDLELHIETHSGAVDIPVKPDASDGGFNLIGKPPALPEGEWTGVVRGQWGFEKWEGPHYHLCGATAGKWAVLTADQSALVVGREDSVRLTGESAQCVDRIEQQPAPAQNAHLVWKSLKNDEIEVAVPLKDAAPGSITLAIHQWGLEKPDLLILKTYSEAAALERLNLSVGDHEAVLKGNRLDEVAGITLEKIEFTIAALSRVQDSDRLTLTTTEPTMGLVPGRHYTALVTLRDGRQLKVPVTVQPSRPQVTLLSKGAQEEATTQPSPVHLGSADDLPIDRRLIFFLRWQGAENFPRDAHIEVAAGDESFHTELTLADGGMMLEDARTALGVLAPMQRFGASAFGPLHIRVVTAAGVTGEWLPLGTLVRMPAFRELRCARTGPKTCTLSGNNLFLITAVSSSQDFENPVEIPGDFTGTQITVPRPANGLLYFKLRDDTETIQSLEMPISTAVAPAAPAASVAAPVAAPTAPAQTN
jgi:hypothetical protein